MPPDSERAQLIYTYAGNPLASGTFRYGVHVFEVTKQRQRWIGREIPAWIHHVCWSPDSTRLAGTGDDAAVYIWDVVTDVLLHRWHGHQAAAQVVTWSPDGA